MRVHVHGIHYIADYIHGLQNRMPCVPGGAAPEGRDAMRCDAMIS